jgi:alkylated DNA nucleotide flippase Atl1
MAPGELVFTVDGSEATPSTPITLAEAGLRERQDLQEWVIAHPEILGTDVLIVTFEFGRWWASDGSRERDRLDVLGIDTDGRLVVVELKRDKAPDTVEMQAIKYASMASRFTEETLVDQFATFRARGGEPRDEDSAREDLLAHVGELDPEQLRQPRIILVAGSFPPVVTASAVWMSEMGIDITLQRVQAYRVFDTRTIITVSQLYPVPDVEEFTVAPGASASPGRSSQEGRRRRSGGRAITRLVESGEIDDGTQLTFRTELLSPDQTPAMTEWLAEDPRRGSARWKNDKLRPLLWEANGNGYRPTPLVHEMFRECGYPRRTTGAKWWLLPDGRSLSQAAGVVARRRFDWDALHRVLASLPIGRWTTSADLAELIGTSPRSLSVHLGSCRDCENAWRIVGISGRPRRRFRWADPEDGRSQEEALTAEGVHFTDGVADSAQRLSKDELTDLLPGDSDGS